MRQIFKNLWIALAAMAIVGCEGQKDPSDLPQPAPQPEVLEPGVVRIYADKTTIEANGADQVTFTVLFGTEEGNKEVSDGVSNMIISYERDGQTTELARSANIFTTSVAGTYTFSAMYYEGQKYFSENTVTVVATPAEQSGVKYYQKLMGQQYTSVGCTYCPILAEEIARIQQEQPGRLLPVSFHVDMNYTGEDPMTSATSKAWMNWTGQTGLPQFYVNMIKERPRHVTNEYALMVAEMERVLEEFPTNCGVAIETSYDPSTRALEVTGKITSNISTRYKFLLMLVEDGINYPQSGYSDYTHNNVLRRAWPEDQVGGFDVITGGGLSTPGEEMQVVRPTFTLPAEWNAENMRVFFAALVTRDGGMSYTVDNCNACKVGESVDYAYEGETPDEGGNEPSEGLTNFQRHVALYEFTSTKCSMCPDGYTTLNMVISAPSFKNKVHMLGFHGLGMGNDPLAAECTAELESAFKITGYPSCLIDLRTGGTVSEMSGTLSEELKASLEDKPAHCGVALESTYDAASRAGTLKVKVAVNEPATYRVAVYVVEDGVKADQLNGAQTIEGYNHRHVVRDMLSGAYTGDLVGKDMAQGDEKSVEYNFTLDSEWDAEKVELYAIAIDDATGEVKNLNYVALGQTADYDINE